MAARAANTANSEHFSMSNLFHWVAVRLGVYVIAAIVPMTVFAAGVVVYAYLWPQRLPVAPQSETPSQPTSTAPVASPLPVQVPEEREIAHAPAGEAGPDQAISQQTALTDEQRKAIRSAVAARLAKTGAKLEVLNSLPSDWNVVGLAVTDAQNKLVGNIQDVKEAPRAREASRTEIVIKLTDDRLITVAVSDMGWASPASGTPTHGIIFDCRVGAGGTCAYR